VTQFTEELPFLTKSDKDWVMGVRNPGAASLDMS
jgi:hypothetical protein